MDVEMSKRQDIYDTNDSYLTKKRKEDMTKTAVRRLNIDIARLTLHKRTSVRRNVEKTRLSLYEQGYGETLQRQTNTVRTN